jgi:hypothetical protein
MTLSDIDVNFDFTTDTPQYWDETVATKPDPDSRSPMMRKYHQLLWSKPLPNGEVMKLEDGRSKFYLKWKDFYFGSDSIIVSFRYKNNQKLINEVAQSLPDYSKWLEDYLREAYTIGGEMIFPSHKGGINQSRGCNSQIRDRWDLTMECIRRHYSALESPLTEVMTKNKAFFDLFVDFKGFVDFFFLQDCVSEDYKEVKMWFAPLYESKVIPDSVDSYMKYIDAEMEFLRKRNKRIENYAKGA